MPKKKHKRGKRPDTKKKKRTVAQREKDMEYTATEYLRGKPQYVIGAALGLTQQQISYDLKELRRRWLESALQDFDTLKAKELAKIDVVESEYWSAWQKSQDKTERKSSKMKEEAGRHVKESGIVTEDQVGDPRFLQGILKCIERRCAILGLDAPKTIAPGAGAGSVVVERIERVILTADQPYIEGEVEH